MNAWTHALAALLRRPTKSASRKPRLPGNANRFRPKVHDLEDRLVPSGSDLFAFATVLTGSLTTDTGTDNTTATGEPGEPNPFGDASINSVWWQWTAPASGTVEVNTQGSALDDTTLAVYTGSSVGNLTLVGMNDDYYNFQSRVQFTAVAGTTYHFAADGFDNLTGGIVLNLATAPANDNFANAAVFTGSSASGWNVLSTAEPGETSPFKDLTINSVWWKWTAPASGAVDFNTVGSSFDTTLAVYTGTSLDALTLVGANDDYNDGTVDFGLQSDVHFVAVNGTTYYMVIDGFKESTGRIALNLNSVTSNDPPAIANQAFSVNENSALGTVVGTVAATDPNAGQTLTYAITGGNPSAAFAIDPATGQITVANPAALDYESAAVLGLTVQVTDNGSPALSAQATVTVNLNDQNDAPQFALAANYNVDENSAAGTPVGVATATDQDKGQTLTYAILDGNAGGAFAIDPATGLITVANTGMLNYEATTSFTLVVSATDNGSPVLSTTTFLTIHVNDVNEAPVTANQQFTANSNDATGKVLGSVPGSDVDAGQTLTYAITGGNAGGAFAINAASGQITVANAAALGTTSSFALTVTVTDNGSPALSATAVVTVAVTQVNHAPVLDNSGNMSLAAVDAGDVNNAGTSVSAILASAGGTRITDVDAGAVTGIAVVAADTTHGSWQYTTNGGSTWSALGAVSGTSARLLAANANTRVRFVPAAGYSGTVTQGITFRAWDGTTGVSGATCNATACGGSTAFSTATETASVTVLSSQQQVSNLTAAVQAITVPSSGVTNSLQSSLNTALAKLQQGNTNAGVNTLNAFISKVQGYIQAGTISAATGQALIDAANAAIWSATHP